LPLGCSLSEKPIEACRRGVKTVHGFFRKRLLQRRIIALAAAYAIALAGLVANFGGAQMAAAAAAQPGGVICHTDFSGDPAPSPDGGADGKTCIDGCCTGCLMLTAALPPPPAASIALTPSAGERIAPIVVAAFAAAPRTYSHRSRAPPLTA
jgi:Protein of unknown function (DUF2946)